MKNTIIYLVGFSGSGIAKAISRTTGAKLVDNHLINNPVFSVIKAQHCFDGLFVHRWLDHPLGRG